MVVYLSDKSSLHEKIRQVNHLESYSFFLLTLALIQPIIIFLLFLLLFFSEYM